MTSSEVGKEMKEIFKYIDDNKDKWVDNLAEAIAIKSVSAWADSRSEVVRMVHWAGDRLISLGATVEYNDIGEQTM
jgi:nonspecific dipeptidase